MIMQDTQRQIEALLFYENKPLSFRRIATLLSLTPKEVRAQCEAMLPFYEGRGIQLVLSEDKALLTVAPRMESFLEQLGEEERGRELSKQAMETLAIILYKGKVRRHDIDFIRGVNSTFILRNLLLRGLIEKESSKQGNLYKASPALFAKLGIAHAGELPHYEEVRAEVERVEQELHALPEEH